MRKRILSMLLALAMVMSLLPMTALADDGDGIAEGSVYFRDTVVKMVGSGTLGTVDQARESWMFWADQLRTNTWGKITVPYAAGKENYKGTNAPLQFSLGSTQEGTVVSYLVDGTKVQEWMKDGALNYFDLSDKLDDEKYVENLNESALEDGQFLFVRCTNWNWDGDEHEHYAHGYPNRIYIAEIDVKDPSDVVEYVEGTTVRIKDVPVSGLNAYSEHGTDNPDKVNLSGMNANKIPMKYEEAIGTKKSVFELQKTGEHSTIQVVMTNVLHDGTEEKVKTAFDDAWAAGDTLSGTDALKVGPEGGKVWVIAKVTSESGNYSDYYVWLVEVSAAPSAHKITKVVVDKDQTNRLNETVDFKKAIDFKGDLTAGSTPEKPVVLTATLKSKIDNGQGQLINVDINNLGVTLTTNGNNLKISYNRHNASSASDASYYEGNDVGWTATSDPNKYEWSFHGNFEDGYAIFLKTTGPVVYEDGSDAEPKRSETKYYKLVVVQEAESDDASIHAGTVIGNYYPESRVTGSITGEMDVIGTRTDFAELTATVPYVEPEKWSAYERSTVKLTVDLGARVRYIVTKSKYDDLDYRDFEGYEGVDNIKKGVTEVTIPKDFDAHKQRVYILVIAPDRTTRSIYVLDNITMAAKGSEGKLTDVVLTQNDKELAENSYAVTFGAESGEDWDNAITVTATVPYESKDTNLAAELEASYGAATYVYELPYYERAEKTFSKKMAIGETIGIRVVSSDQAETTYYKLTLKIAELADKDANDSIVLDLQNGTITVNKGTTVADVKNGLIYGGALQVFGLDDKEVADTAKVGTGFTAKVGTTTLDIIVKGDTTGDGEVDVTDIVAIMKQAAGESNLNSVQIQAADLAAPAGVIDVTDVVAAMKLV